MALTVTGGAIFIWLNSSILSDECEPHAQDEQVLMIDSALIKQKKPMVDG
ncbi:hypothetical protein [Shewanella sp. MF08487]